MACPSNILFIKASGTPSIEYPLLTEKGLCFYTAETSEQAQKTLGQQTIHLCLIDTALSPHILELSQKLGLSSHEFEIPIIWADSTNLTPPSQKPAAQEEGNTSPETKKDTASYNQEDLSQQNLWHSLDSLPHHGVAPLHSPVLLGQSLRAALAPDNSFSPEKQETETSLEQELLSSNAYKKFFSINRDAAMLADLDEGRILTANTKAQEHFGYSQKELEQFSPLELNNEMTQEKLQQMQQNLSSGNKFLHETKHRKKDGSIVDVEVWGTITETADRRLLLVQIRDISHQKEQENLFRALFQKGKDAMLIVELETMRIIDANPKAFEHSGYSKEELLQLTPFDLDVHLDYSNAQQLMASLEKEESLIFETEHRHKDGSVSPAEVMGQLIEHSGQKMMFNVVRDISARKEVEQKLQKRKEFLELLIESLPHPFYVINAHDYTVELANQAAYQLSNLTLEGDIKAAAYTCYQLTHHQNEPCNTSYHPCPLNHIKETLEPITLQHTHFDALGNPLTVEIYGFPILDDNGDLVQMIEYTHDITERKHIEAKLIRAIQDADIARTEAEKANQAKSQFLAAMSHEIRTPMNAIVGMTNLALEADSTEETEDYLSTVKASAEYLMSIINDILDISKIEAGRLEMEERIFSLRKMFQSVYKMFADEIKGRELTFELKIAPDIPDQIIGDEIRLRQILTNLVSNAKKFTKKGGIKILANSETSESFSPKTDELHKLAGDIETESISPKKQNPAPTTKNQEYHKTLRIAVEDTGQGIPKNKQESIFEKFSQADQSTTRNYGGTGLGLAICKQLAELMGGDLILASEVGQGSTFYVELPVRIPQKQKQASPSRPKALQKGLGDTFHTLEILLAEDNPVNIKLAHIILEKQGYKVTIVNNGREALELLPKREFDLILMDVEMPEMDGIEATRHIRTGQCCPGQKNITIIAMTAHALQDIQQKSLDAGMDDYITKPIDADQLRSKLANLQSRFQREGS